MKQKLTAIILCLAMCLTLVPTAALAEVAEVPEEVTEREEIPVLDVPAADLPARNDPVVDLPALPAETAESPGEALRAESPAPAEEQVWLLDAGAWDGSEVDTSWYEGHESPYEISTPAQLAGLAQLVNEGTDTFADKTITLAANLHLGGKGHDWTPIGIYVYSASDRRPFTGTFDGDGHTITGLYIDSTAGCQGLFGYVEGGTVKNLGLVGGDVTASFYVGGVMGEQSDKFIPTLRRALPPGVVNGVVTPQNQL